MSDKKGFMGLQFKMNAAGWLTLGLVGVVVLGIVVYSMTAKRNQGAQVSADVSNKADNISNRTQGNPNSTPDYQAQIQAQNKAAAQQAAQTGQSFVPVPVLKTDKPKADDSLLAQPEPKPEPKKVEAPVEEKNTPAVEKKPEQPKATVYPVNAVAPKNVSQAWTSLAEQMRIMRQPGQSVNLYHPTVVSYKDLKSGDNGTGANAGNSGNASANNGGVTNGSQLSDAIAKVLRPGNLLYGSTIIKSSSAMPNGPFLGQIAGGPLDGARVIGSFQRLKSENLLAVKVNKIIPKEGQPISIDAYVLDPKTTLPAMASDVDYHVLERAGAFMSASFLSALAGYGQAIASSGQTVVTTTTGTTTANPPLTSKQLWEIAAGKAAQDLQKPTQVLDDMIVQPNTIYINENQPFVMMVVSVK